VQSTDVVAVQLAYLASGGLAGIALVVMGIGLQTADDVRTSREILEDLQDRMEDLEIGLDGVVARLPRFPRTEERETR
jgi:chloramphenicol 3-O-phosphotransferase